MNDKSQATTPASPSIEKRLGRRLNLPLSMEAGQAPGFYSSLLYVGFFFVLAVVVWGSIAKVRELANAPGELRPVGSARLVQHVEGGIVSEILVDEGEQVKKGQVLVRLQPTEAVSDLKQVFARMSHLKLQAVRLEALINGQVPAFNFGRQVSPEAIKNQQDIYQAELERYTNERLVLVDRVTQINNEIDRTKKLLASQANLLNVAEEEFKLKTSLHEKRLISESEFLSSKRTYQSALNEFISAQSDLSKVNDSLSEAEAEIRQFETRQREEWTSLLNNHLAELEEIRSNYVKAEARVLRLDVRAPVEGVVQDLLPKAIGQVIKNGEVITQIVPTEQKLIAEVRVDPKDIGHIQLGMTADIKLSTFDPARYGMIKGEVRKVSATTFMTEDGQPYYKATLALERDFIGLNGEQHRILPGMIVDSSIVLGEKTIVRYMLKPVFRALDLAMTER